MKGRTLNSKASKWLQLRSNWKHIEEKDRTRLGLTFLVDPHPCADESTGVLGTHQSMTFMGDLPAELKGRAKNIGTWRVISSEHRERSESWEGLFGIGCLISLSKYSTCCHPQTWYQLTCTSFLKFYQFKNVTSMKPCNPLGFFFSLH